METNAFKYSSEVFSDLSLIITNCRNFNTKFPNKKLLELAEKFEKQI